MGLVFILAVLGMPIWANGAAPGNDVCASAVILTLDVPESGTSVDATEDAGVSSSCFTGTANDVWYSFTPGAGQGGDYVVYVYGTNFDSAVSVHTACDQASIACNDDYTTDSLDRESLAIASMTAETTYLIRVAGYNGATGTFTVMVTLPPDNDTCGTAAGINVDTVYSESSIGAETEGTIAAPTCSNAALHDVWYQFTAGIDGDHTVSLSNPVSTYDPTLAVYSECDVAGYIDCADTGSFGDGESVTFAAVNGIIYYIRVGGYAGQVGDFDIKVVAPAGGPANDGCGAPEILALGAATSGDTSAASDEGAFTSCLAGAISDLWYSFTPGATGNYAFHLYNLSGGFDAGLAVYSDCADGDLLACFDFNGPAVPESGILELENGVPYLIRVGGNDSTVGTFDLVVDTPLANDRCEDAIALVYGVAATGSTIGAVETQVESDCFDLDFFPDEIHWGDVWYEFTPQVAGLYFFDCLGSDFDTIVSVHEGCGGAAIYCNDDYYKNFDGWASCVPAVENISRIGGILYPGQTYHVRVSGYEGNEGDYALTVSLAGDVNIDGLVDIDDLVALAADWVGEDRCFSRADISPNQYGEFNDVAGDSHGDHWVGLNDFAELRMAWGADVTDPGDSWSLITEVTAGQGLISPAGITYHDPDAVVSLTAIAAEDWMYKTWGDDVDSNPAPIFGDSGSATTVTMDDNKYASVEFVPAFTLNAYVQAGNGSIDPAGLSYYENEGGQKIIDVSANPDAGWQVKQWGGAADSLMGTEVAGIWNNTVTFESTDTAKTVWVEFEEIPGYELTCTVGGNPAGGTIDPAGSTTQDVDAVVTLTATPAVGWRVASWTGVDAPAPDPGSCGAAVQASVTMDGPKSVEVTFEQCFTLDVIYGSGNGTIQYDPTGTTVGDVTYFEPGTTVMVYAIPQDNWYFPLNYGSCSGGDITQVTYPDSCGETLELSVIMNSDVSCALTLEECYSLNISSTGDGDVTPDTSGGTLYYVPNYLLTITADPADDWASGDWTGLDGLGLTPAWGDCGDNVSVVDILMTQDLDITVDFVQCHELEFYVNSGEGYVDPCGVTRYPEGTSVDLTAYPNAEWRVMQWGGDAAVIPNARQNTNAVTMNSDKEVWVDFEIIPTQYLLTTQVVGSGTLTPPSGDQDENDVIALLATPDAHWYFAGWSGTDDDGLMTLNNTTTMTSARTVTATFAPIMWTLYSHVHTTDHGSLDIVGYHSYQDGTLVTINATPGPGYKVDYWLVDGVNVGNATSINVMMTANKDVLCKFIKQ